MNSIWQFTRRAGRGIGHGLLISLVKAWQFTRWAGRGIGRGLLISLVKAWQFTRWAGRGIGRGLLISLVKAWQFTRWAGRGIGRGLLISLVKAWQFTRWAGRGIGRGLLISLVKAWQFTRWAGRGLLIFLVRTWKVMRWTSRELLILSIKMVSGPKRGLTAFVALVFLLYEFGGVKHLSWADILVGAGIMAGLVDLVLFYLWVKNRSSSKTNLPVPVSPKQIIQYEQTRPLLDFPSKRIYSDVQRAGALALLHENGNVSSVSQQLEIPQSTLQNWRRRYQREDDFRYRIDKLIWVLSRIKRSHYDNQGQIETNHPH